MAIVEIESVNPLDASLGLPLQTQISVVFNQLMDEATITTSTFLVSGPDNSAWSTPGVRVIENTSPENVLLDFGGDEYLSGTISFSQEDLGGGEYGTKATFTPTTPFASNTEYVIYLAGDEGLDDNIVPPIAAVDSTVLVGTDMWKFTTGSGSVSEVPAISSTAVSVPPAVSSVVSEPFKLLSSIPANRATNLNITTDTIVLDFNVNVDDTTVDSAISILAESVNGDTSIGSGGTIAFTSSVSGGTVTLTMTDSLLVNNAVTVTIGGSLKDENGNVISGDYSFYFTTTYTPLYVTPRRIRLDIGGFLSGIPDDTINLAIFEASRIADVLAFTGTITNQAYFDMVKRNFVICEASGILLQGISMEGGISKKKLGDFEVQYDTGHLPRILNRLADCVDKWQPLLMNGGNEKDFTMAIKGLYDPNRPVIGRVWEKQSGSVPAANTKEAHYYRWRSTWEPRS